MRGEIFLWGVVVVFVGGEDIEVDRFFFVIDVLFLFYIRFRDSLVRFGFYMGCKVVFILG